MIAQRHRDTISLDDLEADWEYPGHGELKMVFMELTENRQVLYEILGNTGPISKKKFRCTKTSRETRKIHKGEA